jgi:hypothetical protein
MNRRLSGVLLVVLVGLALVAFSGCGSVSNVGTGASLGSVTPVSGAYGYSGGGLTDTQLRQQEQKVDSVARSNQVPDNKSATALNRQLKAQPNAASEMAPKAPAQTDPTLEPALKAVVITQEQGLAQATPASGLRPGLPPD